MVHPRLSIMFALAAMGVACSSSDATGPQVPEGDGGGILPDAEPDSGPADGASDSGHDADDAHAPAAPSCQTGDRNEWSGAIPNTLIAVAVCSTCGESYVVAANGSASPGDVSLDNGSTTITTNVPAGGTATTAKLADDPTNGTVSVCGTSGTHGCLPVAPENEQYCDPYRAVASLVPERIDQGVDYAGAGKIYALGPGNIDVYQNRDDTGWPGGTFLSYELSAGPAKGKVIYLAENIDLNPALHSGSFVFSGTVLGTLVNASPNSESGWGVQGASYTAEHACYTEGCNTALGTNFNDLLVCLHAPSGIAGQTGCCTSAAGYPTNWCTLLAGWQ
ncbi:MAG TPA: hypothetical protein VLM85_24145 [Polyangiaceae bacterium]|nr:hypothetical protein [Polyangiaceae bacterium]